MGPGRGSRELDRRLAASGLGLPTRYGADVTSVRAKSSGRPGHSIGRPRQFLGAHLAASDLVAAARTHIKISGAPTA